MLLINCNLVGASFNSVNTYSSVEYDFDSTSFTGGFEIYKNYLSKNEDHIDLDLKYMFNLYGRNLKQNAFATSTDILTIVVVSNGKVSTKVSSTILWNEE
jgi:phosphatidylserine/phosphatidylglycerophosphate/cardiolipin synthase-like enzyme